MSQPSFSSEFKRLNPAQQQAVTSIEGPVMVVAGPGTGKTQVLAMRIANILQQTDTPAHSILALTFTESAAKNMRQRLVSLIGRTGYYLQITTFHAFCSGVIQDHPEYFPIDRGSEPLSDLERYDLFESLIRELELEVLKPLNRPLFYIFDIIKGISDLKREHVTPESLAEMITQAELKLNQTGDELTKTERAKQEKNLAKQTELLAVYKEYQHQLRAMLRYDFDDMISLVGQAFETEELLLREYQERFLYCLVDEYQDTNTAQNHVVDLWASFWGPAANIFVVGDPNQAIYRFQGASLENVLSFLDRYPQAEVITLTTGYRCSQPVYDQARAVIQHNTQQVQPVLKRVQLDADDAPAAFDQPLRSVKTTQLPVQVYEAPSQTIELIFVAEQISALIADGVPPEEIAVLFRHNRDLVELQQVLEKWGIGYEIDGGINVLEAESIRQLLTFFQTMQSVVLEPADGQLFEVMNYSWLPVEPVVAMKLARAAGANRTTMVKVIEAGYEAFIGLDVGPPLSPEQFNQAEKLLAQFQTWVTLDAQSVFTSWFEAVIDQSGYLEWVLHHPTKIEYLNNLNSLFRQIKSLVETKPGLKLAQFLQAIETMQTHNIALPAEDLNLTQGAVRLSTVHKAKGQEWQYVFMIHCLDGKWGNTRQRQLLPLPEEMLAKTDLSAKEKNEDDRRLFYVALTRASQQVTISYPQTIISDSSSSEVVPSMFLAELDRESSDQVVALTQLELVSRADQLLEKLVAPVSQPGGNQALNERQFLHQLVDEFVLSVTALNTYLRDPAEFVENVLLRVPRAKEAHLAYGTAVHAALEFVYQQQIKTGHLPPFEKTQAEFDQALKQELLTAEDFSRRLATGTETLQQYYSFLAEDGVPEAFQTERFFGSGWSKAVLGDIPLKGRVDRVDWINKSTKKVKVVDYKTGSPKSVNVIEGKTKSQPLSERERALPEPIRGPYKRQLLFYKLLADLDPTFVPEVTHGSFEFVEGKGKVVVREFEFYPEDVKLLADLLQEVMTEIRALQFLELME